MEVFALLFASKYGLAALGSVTLAAGMLVGTFWLLAQKANRPMGQVVHANKPPHTGHHA